MKEVIILEAPFRIPNLGNHYFIKYLGELDIYFSIDRSDTPKLGMYGIQTSFIMLPIEELEKSSYETVLTFYTHELTDSLINTIKEATLIGSLEDPSLIHKIMVAVISHNMRYPK